MNSVHHIRLLKGAILSKYSGIMATSRKRLLNTGSLLFSDKSTNNGSSSDGESKGLSDDGGIPSAPTTCCMSGCHNCVWLDYADEIVSYYKKKGETLELTELLKEIDQQIQDPMIKVFVKMELKSKFG